MNSPLISVIIPVYNADRYLKKCLDSIENQTFNNLQIILIDDGSDDTSFSICNEYAASDPRFEVYYQENRGVSSARNLGIKYARGYYLTFVDCDDRLDPETYEKVIKHIGECDALYYGYKEIYDNGTIKNVSPEMRGTYSGYEALYYSLLPLGYYSSVCNKVFKTDRVEGVFFDEEIQVGEDELWLTEATKSLQKVYLMSDALYNYVQRKDSAMHDQNRISAKWMSALQAKKKILHLLENDEKCLNLAKAKLYSDLYYLKCLAYVSKDKDQLKRINKDLSLYKHCFYNSDVYSIRRKIKYSTVDLLMALRFPHLIVQNLNDITYFKIKSGIRN